MCVGFESEENGEKKRRPNKNICSARAGKKERKEKTESFWNRALDVP
jgi:hypothetical protein